MATIDSQLCKEFGSQRSDEEPVSEVWLKAKFWDTLCAESAPKYDPCSI